MERKDYLLDKGWRFQPADVEAALHPLGGLDSYQISKAGGIAGPGGIAWSDAHWRELTLPHDWYAETPVAPENLHSHGYRTRGNAWYRRHFKAEDAWRGCQVLLCFEGLAVEASVYLNGSLMTRSFSAYNELTVDITDRIRFGGADNVIAVYIDGMATEGWWYEGAGIYRPVHLLVKAPVHIAHNGVFVKPVRTPDGWRVETELTVENTGYIPTDCHAALTLSLDGVPVASGDFAPFTCPADGRAAMTVDLPVADPRLWDVDTPVLYRADVRLFWGGEEQDRERLSVGFRTIRFDAEQGFFLNDRPLKIKGVCCHQDHAGVGTGLPVGVQEYRLRRIKEMGANAYRSAHNLPSRELLDLCDRLGILVMDENRRFESNPYTLSCVEDMVRRDRNHPCVILYSLFNEEVNLQGTAEGRAIFRRMYSAVKRLDDTRPVMGALNGGFFEEEGTATAMDVTGINYALDQIEAFHAAYPVQPLIGSENDSALSTRGCTVTDKEVAQVLADYGDEYTPWGSTLWQAWDFVRSHPYMAGLFVWTGFDYRGEPLPFSWPSCSSQFGLMDTCGFAKEGFYQAQACFKNTPVLHLFPHWNGTAGEPMILQLATNGDEVELFVNGVSQGRRPTDVCTPTRYEVIFAPGEVTAVSYKNGEKWATCRVETAGAPAQVQLIPAREWVGNDGCDTLPVAVCLLDEKGRVCPTATNFISFSVEGEGQIIGVGNGDPNSHESDKDPCRHLFAGWSQVLLQPQEGAAQMTLVATADGCAPGRLVIPLREVAPPQRLDIPH